MNHPLHCRCGTVRGHVTPPAMAPRAICYCRDCQAFAHYLGQADTVLDANGGTQITALLPERVHFTLGQDQLACLSLKPRGLLRWYARCCNTPIANIPPEHKLPYVGVIHSCLETQRPTLEDSFGPVRIALHTVGAIGTVPGTPLRTTLSIVQIMRAVLFARVSGRYRKTPFFDTAGKPIRAPTVLTPDERARVTPA